MANKQLPFDASKLQPRFSLQKQKERRRELIKWSLVPTVLMVMFALWCLLPSLLTYPAIKSYDKKDYHKARSWLTPLTVTSPEQFVIAFNSGTVDSQLKRYTQSEAELTRALALAPVSSRCMVIQNLVITYKEHAVSVHAKDAASATQYQTKADTLIKVNPQCFRPQGAQNSGGGGGGGSSSGPTGASNSTSDAPTPDQLQALQQKEDVGQQQLQQQADQQTLDPSNPHIKQW